MFVNDLNNSRLMRRKLFSCYCFTHFPKTTAPQLVVFSGKLSTIINFILCKFSVNLWTLFFVLQKLHRPFKYLGETALVPSIAL